MSLQDTDFLYIVSLQDTDLLNKIFSLYIFKVNLKKIEILYYPNLSNKL